MAQKATAPRALLRDTQVKKKAPEKSALAHKSSAGGALQLNEARSCGRQAGEARHIASAADICAALAHGRHSTESRRDGKRKREQLFAGTAPSPGRHRASPAPAHIILNDWPTEARRRCLEGWAVIFQECRRSFETDLTVLLRMTSRRKKRRLGGRWMVTVNPPLHRLPSVFRSTFAARPSTSRRKPFWLWCAVPSCR